MATISVVNMKGEEVSTRKIADSVFNIEPNSKVMHLVVVNHLANSRQGTQSTLTRSEVRGGGKKPWRQKGTGRARQGSIRSVQWVHGGVALGPKPRSYRFSINKKVRRLAMKSALSDKFKASNIVLIDRVEIDTYKTKLFIEMLNSLKLLDKKALFVFGQPSQKVVKSASNIVRVSTAHVGELNVYDILNHDSLVLDVGALERIEEVYA